MIQHLRLIIFVQALLVTVPVYSSDTQQERFALVIGNQNYEASPLRNALYDARSLSAALTDLKFGVTRLEDVNSKSMSSAIEQFYEQVRLSDSLNKLVVVYYAGHAMQINQANYLIPLQADVASEEAFMASLYHLSSLFEQMQAIPGLQNIVILDACRDNPFEGSIAMSASRGLAPVKAPAGTLIAFATEPGGVASDGTRGNGTYTKHLLRYLADSVAVEEMFKRVRTGVAKDTRNRQIPWEHSSLLNEVFLSPPKNKDLPNIVVF